MGLRRKSREFALQMLFQADLGHQTREQVQASFWRERIETEPEARDFTEDIFRVACERHDEINAVIERHADNWRVDRMSAVDRNILRAAVAEMLAFPATPAAVVINESLEIARKFSAPESIQFINGVLDSAAREIAKKTVER